MSKLQQIGAKFNFTDEAKEWLDDHTFDRAIACIQLWGAVEPFWKAHRKYLYVGERKYWHMGEVSSGDVGERPGLINRSWIDLVRYRGEASELGYGDDEIDGLLMRWKDLLRRATGSQT